MYYSSPLTRTRRVTVQQILEAHRCRRRSFWLFLTACVLATVTLSKYIIW